MSKNPGVLPRWLHRCAASLLLVLASCSQVPPTSSAVIPPIPDGTARIWIYRAEGPYESQERPYLRFNGQVAGISEPNGALYRNVPPGRYTVSVDSYGVPYPNQFAQVDLGAGQETFIKVSSLRERVGGEVGVGTRALFFTQLVAADAARAAIASTPFYGGS
jgi:hypothetical protein